VFDHLTQLVSQASGWAYVIIFVLAFVDAMLPIVPSETSVITAGVVASAGELDISLVIGGAAVGAFLGDNVVYLAGRRFGERARQPFFGGEKAKARIDWAERQLQQRAGQLITGGRFIPGGRTAVALCAGLTHFPWRRYVVLDAFAALAWALYASLLGYLGGRAFEDQPWKGLVLAIGVAFAVAGGVEAVRWYLARRRGASTTSES
jgi:membrane protein DedA with SNARE-associated domain